MERFWGRVNRRGDNDCWEWQRGRGTCGYGRFWLNGKTRNAHRVAWELTYGDLPDEMCVLHSCDNRSCVNPSHLFLGTQEDNTRDRHQKGRDACGERSGRHTQPWRTARGERQGGAKLSPSDVLAIREARSKGVHLKDLAAQYGVSFGHIGKLCRGYSWNHVKEEGR